MDELISIWEIAKQMGVTKRRVQQYIEDGDLKAVALNMGRGRPLYHSTAKDIEDFHARRAAKKRIREQAERFGDGLNGKEL